MLSVKTPVAYIIFVEETLGFVILREIVGVSILTVRKYTIHLRARGGISRTGAEKRTSSKESRRRSPIQEAQLPMASEGPQLRLRSEEGADGETRKCPLSPEVVETRIPREGIQRR